MASDYQPSLLSDADLRAADLSWAYNRPAGSTMAVDELQGWKQRVAQYQATVRSGPPVTQGTLFEPTDASPADTLNPFGLAPQNSAF
ncbi:MAG: GIY-YIG nuclease family protein, partial [Cyanobacteria bacterium J06638_6]